MSTSISPITLSGDCEIVAKYLIQELSTSGCQVIRSFDLQGARKAHNCVCPHHGDAQCSCQMIFLLAYFPNDAPHSIILHGHDNTTFVSWDENLANRKKEILFNLLCSFSEKDEAGQFRNILLEI